MSRFENPPFPRGTTFYDGSTPSLTDDVSLAIEGCEWEFEDEDLTVQGVKPKRSKGKVLCRAVRNVSTAVLLPKRLATASLSSGLYGCRAYGMSDVTNEKCIGAVDEFLPSAGCPVNDICWVVIRGPAMLQTAHGSQIAFSVGDYLGAGTAAASTGGTQPGKVHGLVLTVTEAPLANAIRNSIGQAMTARTTNETNTDTLVRMNTL